MKIGDFFSLETSMIKSLLRPTYWLAVITVIVGSLSVMNGQLVLGLIYLALGMCVARIVYEVCNMVIELYERVYPTVLDDDEP